METRRQERDQMVESQLARRGIEDSRVLDAFRRVPREEFVDPELGELAYRDSPLPIAHGQTISQPFIVALMAQAAEIRPDDRVLEIGAGSGYAAAVLGELAEEVVTIDRHPELVRTARERLERLGYDHVRAEAADGTLGWPDDAPYDAILVAAGGPEIPEPLLDQLAPGGRLVIPVGTTRTLQQLVRVRRDATTGELRREDLGGVRFVPLVGEAGWEDTGEKAADEEDEDGEDVEDDRSTAPSPLVEALRRAVRELPPVDDVEGDHLAGLLDRIGDARVVLLGEATHGTSEFYRLRARITRELIERRGFSIVAVESDWPDASVLDRYVRDLPGAPPAKPPFQRFPTWMWANREVLDFVRWLRRHNQDRSPAGAESVGFYGLDLYSLSASIDAVVRYLDDVDPETARVARERYGCLSPWESDPATYGRAALTGRYRECEDDVVAMLEDLLTKRLEYARRDADGARFLDAVQNARLVANAERYYRVMYYGPHRSWNLRDQHMFDTLEALLDFRGPDSRAVVWEHNSHVGDASATAMGERGEHNVGELCRRRFGDDAYLIGFGTHTGTVAAASDWGGPMEVKTVRPSHPASYERLCHDTGIERFLLPLRHAADDLRDRLSRRRLERAIGVVYRPDTELQSHYFEADLPNQFDEWIWLDETRAVIPIERRSAGEDGAMETFPFGV